MWTLKLIWYHIFQFFFAAAEHLLPWHLSKSVKGENCVLQIPEYLKKDKVERVLLVTDPTLTSLGLTKPLLDALRDSGITCTVYDKVQPNPTIDSIEEARQMYLDNNCQGLIAFGGGSSMDCAKAAGARVVKPNQSIQQMGGTLRVQRKLPPLYAVPTTAGTGSETTVAAVVTDSKTHHKYAINDLNLIPKYAFLDPALTVGLPPHITSTTGMDALTHAVEAYTNRYAPKYTQELSIKATKTIFSTLEGVYANGKDMEGREKMLEASYQAGAAFTRACVGNVHAIAHTLGGLYGVPHGLANSVILPIVMEDFGPKVYKKLARLADEVGLKGNSEEEKAKAFIAEIRRMNKAMNIPDHLDMIQDEDIPQMIKWAMAEANPIYPVPEIWNEDQFRRTIEHVRGHY